MIVTENNQEVDKCSFKASSDEVINNNSNNIEKTVDNDLIEKSQVKFADLVAVAQPENQQVFFCFYLKGLDTIRLSFKRIFKSIF